MTQFYIVNEFRTRDLRFPVPRAVSSSIVTVTIDCNTPPSHPRSCELFKRNCRGDITKVSISRPKRKRVEYVRVDQRISHLVDHCGLSLSLELCKDDNNEDDQALRLKSSMP
jgi:hypothetical protein